MPATEQIQTAAFLYCTDSTVLGDLATSCICSGRRRRATIVLVTFHLPAARLQRIDARDRIDALVVLDGCLWLTTTPADDDIILRTGDTWVADRCWPVVLQTIQATTIRLVLRDEQVPAEHSVTSELDERNRSVRA